MTVATSSGTVAADAAGVAGDALDRAARLGVVPATPGVRSIAFAIDAGIWLSLASPAVVGAVLVVLDGPQVVPVVLIAAGAAAASVFGLVQLLVHGRRGVTVGKRSMRLRSVSARTLERPGFWRIALRALVLWCSGILPLVGPAVLLASGLWDPRRRGRSILDRVGACWLVDTRAGVDPFDRKAVRRGERALDPFDDRLDERIASMATGAASAQALRIPEERSRAGVVGPDGTGARWQTRSDAAALPLIDAVPVVASGPPTASGGHRPETPDPQNPPFRRRSTATLRFDDGTAVRVPAVGLMGRKPEPAAGEQIDAALDLDDPDMLLSKTHLSFGQDAEGVWIVDRGSRNGTTLTDPAGSVVIAAAGERMRVPDGWSVHIGGRSFEVLARGVRP